MHTTRNQCFVVVALLLGVTAVLAEYESPCKDACPIRYKCSNEELTAWASDRESCFVFRNECHLNNENCQRQNRCEKELLKVDKEECQKLCPIFCPAIYSPICAIHNDEKKDFSNECAMNGHICDTGVVWSIFKHEVC